MYSVSNNEVTMTRGDTLILHVTASREGQAYVPEEGDVVRFALKSQLNGKGTAYKEAEPLILKEIPTDTMILRLDPDDTKSLLFGQYTYDIEITFASGIVDTFITAKSFTISPEVH